MALGSRALLNAVDRALRDFKKGNPNLPQTHNRKTIADIGKPRSAGNALGASNEVPDLDKSLQAIRKRGVLRVGIHPGVEGLCVSDGAGDYSGLEPVSYTHLDVYKRQHLCNPRRSGGEGRRSRRRSD